MSVLGAGIYLFEEPGWRQLRIRRYAKKLRTRIGPVASTLDVKTSVRNDERGVVIYYTFTDGNFVSLSVGDGGFNYFTPTWNPGYEKNTEGLPSLMAAIEEEYGRVEAVAGR
ncbi:hypothetical protein [Janthinobacterium sp. HLX7-2]|uniref:hypothetical protein n=1 Tax=Janthinobacterium sp. HLX7-2 TaxID=1259331 RepID=UPI003F527EEA